MYKLLRKDCYICDTAQDLVRISEREKDMGATCYVIKEACDYKLMSTGEWVKQAETAVAGDVDLTGYATEEFVNKAIATIDVSNFATKAAVQAVANKIPDTSGFAKNSEVNEVKTNPILKVFDFTRNTSKEDGQSIYLAANDTTTLAQAMQAKGLGLYNIWISKTRSDLPASMIANNTSGRGFACVDLQTKAEPEKFIGYAVLFDKLNRMYYKFFNKGVEGPWMKVSAEEDK